MPVVGLSKKQMKRRRDSRLGLRYLVEEMESNDSKAGASVYDTFHGAEQKKRSRSWSELHWRQTQQGQYGGDLHGKH